MKEKKDIICDNFKEKYDLSPSNRIFILQMCWAQHDGQWFLKTSRKHDYKEANHLNQEVLFAIAKIEARYVLNALNIKRESIKSIQEISKIIITLMDVLFPKIMKMKHIIESDTIGYGIVKKCFIWDQVKKANVENEYECACFVRYRGWLKAMGVDANIIPLFRFPDGDDFCKFKFILNETAKK